MDPFPVACWWSRVAVIVSGAAYPGEERKWRAGDNRCCMYKSNTCNISFAGYFTR